MSVCLFVCVSVLCPSQRTDQVPTDCCYVTVGRLLAHCHGNVT